MLSEGVQSVTHHTTTSPWNRAAVPKGKALDRALRADAAAEKSRSGDRPLGAPAASSERRSCSSSAEPPSDPMKRQKELSFLEAKRLGFTKRTQEPMCFQQKLVAYAGETSRFKQPEAEASAMIWPRDPLCFGLRSRNFNVAGDVRVALSSLFELTAVVA
jgi:hypothetical protein